jgi:pimeloyl-ACP methyl ester carboxylesterase
MHYLQQGSGEPLLFIHGFPETSYEWRHQFAAFAADYACFAPDLRGFGETDKPGARVSRQLLAQDVVNFMDALGIDRAAVVAHDWGGIVAFKLAIDWPERVTRLALLDTLCTVWTPGGVHGYWFKAAPLPEEFFAEYHAEFIETVCGAAPSRPLPSRPLSPWQSGARPGGSTWATAEDITHYKRAFADPDSHAHAISYYRYALPFHIVTDDPPATHGEHYRSLSEPEVAAMWNHPEGLEQHPLFVNYMDYGPEDRHKRFPNPTLWMFGSYLSRSRGTEASGRPEGWIPAGNPFSDQFSRYFPDLRARAINAGHFFPEEAAEETNGHLRAFLEGRL